MYVDPISANSEQEQEQDETANVPTQNSTLNQESSYLATSLDSQGSISNEDTQFIFDAILGIYEDERRVEKRNMSIVRAANMIKFHFLTDK